ncbi:hypothetical protein [Ornithinimicrobium sp. INDO-MA30-4]|uniref:hypothetical protein n=1 Tax=Ornithinimicrobium sp. INDO-MA30-4 TaxID=2908651 RepID=UPI00288320BA|nr:hypothetical protein [Ornithinimicrobium sp. INDO-MA30-4]
MARAGSKMPSGARGVEGTDQLQPVGSALPKVRKFTVEFGKPINVAEKYAGVPAGKARRAVTDEIQNAVLAMTGQEFADDYNQRPPSA